MAFDDYEKSAEGGTPVELYEFDVSGTVTRFTSSEEDVTYLSNTFTAISIARNNFGQATGERQDNLIIIVPAKESWVQQFIATPPGTSVGLILRRFHTDDPDNEVKVIFQGNVTSVVFSNDGHHAEIHVVPATSRLTQQIPRFNYSGLCNHLLYDARCKISEHNPSFEKFLNISAVTDDLITADGASGFGADFFEAGFVAWSGDYRLVIKQTGDVLKLLLPFQTSPVGHTVRCLAGCKLRVTDCVTKFANILNFGGFPWIPTKNPFSSGLD